MSYQYLKLEILSMKVQWENLQSCLQRMEDCNVPKTSKPYRETIDSCNEIIEAVEFIKATINSIRY